MRRLVLGLLFVRAALPSASAPRRPSQGRRLFAVEDVGLFCGLFVDGKGESVYGCIILHMLYSLWIWQVSATVPSVVLDRA